VPLKLSGKAVTFGIYIFLLSIEIDPFEYSEISEPRLLNDYSIILCWP